MKKFLVCLLFLNFSMSFAQITEGKITYSMTLESNDFENEESEYKSPETTIELYFSGEKTRTSVQSGSEMNVTSIIDNGAKKTLLVMTGMMGNLAITTDYTELVESTKASKIEIQFLEQTKEIKGYNCKKAKITDEAGNRITCWYSEEILCNKSGLENMYQEIRGTPLEYRVDSDGTTMIFTLKEVKTKLDNLELLFSTNTPEGYKALTMAEFEAGEF